MAQESNQSAIVRLWNRLPYWQRGALLGSIAYGLMASFALLLCLYEYFGGTTEGYIGAGWILIFFGLPTTLLESLIESAYPSFRLQLVNIFLLAFLNSLIVGSLVGFWVGRDVRQINDGSG